MKNLIITQEIWKEGNMYTSYCPELDVASCGRTIEEAQKNLIEVILIQLEETAKMGTLKEFLENAGYETEVEMDELRLDKQLVKFDELAIPFGVL
jgi:predicted RNase H-like HicB family nuclease